MELRNEEERLMRIEVIAWEMAKEIAPYRDTSPELIIDEAWALAKEHIHRAIQAHQQLTNPIQLEEDNT